MEKHYIIDLFRRVIWVGQMGIITNHECRHYYRIPIQSQTACNNIYICLLDRFIKHKSSYVAAITIIPMAVLRYHRPYRELSMRGYSQYFI